MTIWQNTKYGCRKLIASPSYALVALFTLAMGMGANTAIFSIANALLLRPLPGIGHPNELVQLYRSSKKNGIDNYSDLISYPNFLDYREKKDLFPAVAAWRDLPVGLSADGKQPMRMNAAAVSSSFFSLLQVSPVQGRFFRPDEDEAVGSTAVAVVSYRTWQSFFGADRNLTGKSLRLNGLNFTIIGVAPPGFQGLNVGNSTDLWVPITMVESLSPGNKGWLEHRNYSWLYALARLRPGSTLAEARAGASVVALQMQQAYPRENKTLGLYLASNFGLNYWLRGQIVQLSLTLGAIAVLVLFIACLNLANLTLAHTLKRAPEIAIRLALGASRAQVVWQLLTENLLLSFAGGLLGLVIAYWATHVISTFVLVQQNFPSLHLTVDYRVMLFALACAVLCGLGFGLWPALRVSRPELIQTIKTGAPGTGHSRYWGSDLLVVLQVGLGLLVVVATGLLLQTFRNYQFVDRGFDAHNVALVPFDLTLENYSESRGQLLQNQVLHGLRSMPGFQTAAFSMITPISGAYLETQASTPDGQPSDVDINVVSEDYFQCLNLPIKRGRGFRASEVPNGKPVAVISEAAARRFGIAGDPIGKVLDLPRKPTGQGWVEVVGVVADSKSRGLAEPARPIIYFPLSQNYTGQLVLMVRASRDPNLVLPDIQKRINEYDKDFPATGGISLEHQIDASLGQQSMITSLVSALGILSLLLGMVGLYGLLFYLVSQRSRDIGVRLALGAQRWSIFYLVAGHALRLTIVGTAIGIIAVFFVMRLLNNALYGIAPNDPVTIASVSALLIGLALLASSMPAYRATKVDPVLSLRQQ